MGKPKQKDLPDLSHLAVAGAEIPVRVTPKASRNAILLIAQAESGQGVSLKITVTAAPENGKATAAVQALLARAMRIAPSDLELLRGATSRDKVFAYRP
ncbi:UPF0235 protein [Phaeobacter inhibens]|uniref:DUF167 domain-containing protein n=1 Tax=Phaeobacter inhibens TaxID=221822 RepID=UPI000C99DE3D|nr:DUF167 domain-containing protein [Phaeobacter inhibens]AUQ55014.1 hypothetical protein PhaeoP92_02351 [Phaeobacter inhibens]AUQ79030.1 hypothetical protein PhaeoP74_02352 [Phaeobacter inhibens]AUR16189.1 hypothetical protein PhaeoP70_02350 [Phaeobacter inhibens]UWR42237.1 DUF167 domain-containing protein [Phaeobacter inhibens]UWR47991.1 DUF167 domain-containing protein [Phaeobacter inhibens]